MEISSILKIPGERPFRLYDNRIFISVGPNGASDIIVKGNLNFLTACMVRAMLDYNQIAEMVLAAADEYRIQKNQNG
jgi:hypothetical protein